MTRLLTALLLVILTVLQKISIDVIADLTDEIFSDNEDDSVFWKFWNFWFGKEFHEKPNGNWDFYALVPFLLVWVTLLSILAVTHKLSSSTSKIPRIYDIYTKRATYKYIIVIKHIYQSLEYARKSSHLLIDFLDEHKLFITRLAVPPRLINNMKGIRVKVTKFRFYRSKPMDLGYVRISHDCWHKDDPTITITSFTVKGLQEKISRTIQIDRPINYLPPDADDMEQVFATEDPQILDSQDEDVSEMKLQEELVYTEYALFLIFYMNLVSILVLLVPHFMQLNSPSVTIRTTLEASFIAIALTLPLALFYSHVVKRGYISSGKSQQWSMLKWTFTLCIYALAVVFSVVAVEIAGVFHQRVIWFWFFAIFFSLEILAAVLTVYLIVSVYLLTLEANEPIEKPKEERKAEEE